jgi:hypothetical protein
MSICTLHMQCLSFTSYECNDEIDIPIAKRVLNNTGINCNEINIFTSSKVVIQTILLNLWLDNVPLFLRTTIGHEKSHYQGYDHVVLFLTLIICNLIVFH